jgi:hypothetical protein
LTVVVGRSVVDVACTLQLLGGHFHVQLVVQLGEIVPEVGSFAHD